MTLPLTFVADRGDARLRLDQVLVRRLTDVPWLSRTRVQRWIDQRLILVNGRPARRAAAPVAAGDRIAVLAPEALEKRAAPAAETGTLEVLYEDEHLLVLNKPPGIVVHPTYKHASGTLFNAVLGHVQRKAAPSDIADAADTTNTSGTAGNTPRLVHRLDKGTSGVLIVSKTHAAHVALQRAMATGHVRKEYLAVVHGTPRRARGTITLPLGRDSHDRRRVVARDDGRASETRFDVVGRGAGMSVMRCDLITGRMHQIRVHLASSGWPIVGDPAYGKVGDALTRQALHAWRLSFPHPVSGKRMEVTAPVPQDMETLLKEIPGATAAVRPRAPSS